MKTPLLAAGLGPWIPFIVFFVFITLSLLHVAWQRGRRSDRSDPEGWGGPARPLEEGEEVSGGTVVVRRYVRPGTASAPPPMPAPAPRPLTPWEAELEELLGGGRTPTPAPTPAPPVPPVLPRASTESRPVPAPPPERRWESSTVEDLLESSPESAPMPSAPLASLAQAENAYGSGATLQERVHEYLARADRKVERATPVMPPGRKTRPPELDQLVAGLRRPATARQAILVSLVLGRPKGLET